MLNETMVKASLDVGENVTALLEKLAHQIGTTADQVFPWYVKQSVLEGWLFLACISAAVIVALTIFIPSFKKADFGTENKYAIFAAISGMILSIVILVLLMGVSWAVTSISNPNYHAIKAIVADLSKLK